MTEHVAGCVRLGSLVELRPWSLAFDQGMVGAQRNGVAGWPDSARRLGTDRWAVFRDGEVFVGCAAWGLRGMVGAWVLWALLRSLDIAGWVP